MSSIVIPPGLHLSAQAVGDFTVETKVSKAGRPYTKVEGRAVAGTQFVKCTQFIEPGESPVLPSTGERFTASITGVDSNEKGREVIAVFVKIARPSVVSAEPQNGGKK